MTIGRTVVGVDTAKRVFQLHWVDTETGEIVDLKLTLRWLRLFRQSDGSAKVYSDLRSGRQYSLESLFLLLLLRLWRCGQGAERLVHHIHRRLASVGFGRGGST